MCDASETAYAAVLYSRVMLSDGSYQMNIIVSKTKVAPIAQVSLPWLELCGAQFLARLFKKCTQSLNHTRVYAWTDSTIVLSWLSTVPCKWKSFHAEDRMKSWSLVSLTRPIVQVVASTPAIYYGIHYGGKAHHGYSKTRQIGQLNNHHLQVPLKRLEHRKSSVTLPW